MKKVVIAVIASGLLASIFTAPAARAIDCYKLPDSKTSKCQAYLKAAKKAGLVQTDTQEVPLAPAVAQRDAGRKVSESVKVPKAETKPTSVPVATATPTASTKPLPTPSATASTKVTSKASKKPKAKKNSKSKSKSKITSKPKAKKSPKAKSSTKNKAKSKSKKK
jgi:hypothetical protein